MDTYRIEKTDTGWAMFKAGRARPVIEADTKGEVVRLAEQHLTGTKASVRLVNANGTFQELRL
ncbi:DUF2188 domain-containing protein [Pseudomonas spelaei]|uniref:DUF2188 domain-containing protein n=1 Tax=Pseudomonas spelaei TaxID=1055469 RepID=UPI00360DF39E